MDHRDSYYVAIKLFLRDGAGRLLIIKDRFGEWDLPGGRSRENDFETPLPDVAERKAREELGSDVSYELDEPAVFMRHERDELLPEGSREKRRIFAIGYNARYTGGGFKLGNGHERYEWVDISTFDPEKYFTGGWLLGIKEYQARVART